MIVAICIIAVVLLGVVLLSRPTRFIQIVDDSGAIIGKALQISPSTFKIEEQKIAGTAQIKDLGLYKKGDSFRSVLPISSLVMEWLLQERPVGEFAGILDILVVLLPNSSNYENFMVQIREFAKILNTLKDTKLLSCDYIPIIDSCYINFNHLGHLENLVAPMIGDARVTMYPENIYCIR